MPLRETLELADGGIETIPFFLELLNGVLNRVQHHEKLLSGQAEGFHKKQEETIYLPYVAVLIHSQGTFFKHFTHIMNRLARGFLYILIVGYAQVEEGIAWRDR